MMEYSDFTKEIRERLKDALGAGHDVSIQQICGNNGIKWDAAVISVSGSSTAECMAVSSYYELCREEEDLEIVIEELVGDYRKRKSGGHVPDMNTVYDWKMSREGVIFRLVNTGANRQLLHEIPHFGFLDLSMVFYLLLDSDAEGCRSIMITNMLLKKWGISERELLHQAQKNTPLRMPEIILDAHSLFPAETADDPAGMQVYVLTNRLRLYGAGCVLYEGVLEKAAGMCWSGFYVLPCSVHELLLIPAERYSQGFAQQLKQLVMEVNLAEVPEQDILSDCIYYYNKEEKRLDIAL